MAKCNFPTCPSHAQPNGYCVAHGFYAEDKKGKVTKDNERKKSLTAFYEEQLNIMPDKCQECGELLFKSMSINPRTVIAHILPKAHYPSVEVNPDNVLYLCQLHHGRYDNQTQRFMNESKLAPLIRQKVKLLTPLLTDKEKARLPEYLK